MKQYIVKVVFFLLPCIILAYPLDILFGRYLKQEFNIFSGEISVWEDIYQKKINPNCFIYGSSVAFVHIDPKIINETTNLDSYNFGADGQKFPFQLQRHNQIIQHLSPPQYIIHCLDMNMFNKIYTPLNKGQYLPYMLWNEGIQNDFKPYPAAYSKADFLIPFWRYRGIHNSGAILSSLKDRFKSPPLRILGYMGQERSWDGKLEWMKKNNKLHDVTPDNNSIIEFEKYIKDITKSKIQLIFVFPPQYYEANDIFVGEDRILSLFDDLSKKYNIPYFNYTADSLCYNKKHFYNSTHLNKEGSQIFSKKFADDFAQYLASKNKSN